MIKILPFIGLTLFFLILAERITVEAAVIGLAISWLVLRLLKTSSHQQTGMPLYAPVFWGSWIRLFAVLVKEIILANFQVAQIVLSKNMPIAPKVYQFTTRLKDERLVVLLSNAITLTPGTMTVDLKESLLTIHALNENYFQALSSNPIEKILLGMEAKLNG